MLTTILEALALGFISFMAVRFLLIKLIDKVVLLRAERISR